MRRRRRQHLSGGTGGSSTEQYLGLHLGDGYLVAVLSRRRSRRCSTASRRKNPNVSVKYTSAGDELPTALATAVEGGNPPTVAFVVPAGPDQDFVKKGASSRSTMQSPTCVQNLGQSAADIGSVDGKLYGVLYKAANKSLVWYNVQAFTDAGVEPADLWDDYIQNGETIKASGRAGVLDRRRRRLADHRPLREHLSEPGGAGELRQARQARDPVDRSDGQGRPDDDGAGAERQ